MTHVRATPLEIAQEVLQSPCCQSSLQWRIDRQTHSLPEEATLTCLACSHPYLLAQGILDFLGSDHGTEVITPFQRLMQFPPIARVYEKWWRPIGFFIASSSSFHKFSTQIVGLVGQHAGRCLLDLACGPGLLTTPLAERTEGVVFGLDLSMPMLRQARRRLHSRQIRNVLLVRGSAFRLPFRDETFSGILCSGALHLFDQPTLALAEISRTLARPAALVCQTTLRPKHSAGLASFLESIIRFGFFSSPEEIQRLLKSEGLTVTHDWRRRIIYLFEAKRL
ncbi:MAG: class I SAM-dependent methyltransferase [Acidobacteriota bacterium]